MFVGPTRFTNSPLTLGKEDVPGTVGRRRNRLERGRQFRLRHADSVELRISTHHHRPGRVSAAADGR